MTQHQGLSPPERIMIGVTKSGSFYTHQHFISGGISHFHLVNKEISVTPGKGGIAKKGHAKGP
jgi:hypothetical protein